MGSEREDFNSVKVALVSMTAILACVPVIMLPFALKPVLRPSAELFVVGWGCVSDWFRPPFLYVVLNVVIVTLGVKSGALTTSCTNDQTEVSDNTQMENSTNLYMSIVVAGSDSEFCTTPKEDNVAIAIEEGVAVSKLAEICGVSSHLINEVDAGQITSSVCSEEKEKEEEEKEMLSAEELYEKSEMFIGNFYRELKLQQIY